MHKVRIGVLVSGGGTNLQTLIDAIEQGDINGEIAVVISDREEAYALERAKKHGIKPALIDRKAYQDKDMFNTKLIDELKEMKIELVVLAGFLSILKPEFIKAFEGRIMNIHPSLIPSFCGKGFYGEKVHQAVVEYGVKLSGATVHFVDEGTDSGPIILQESIAIDENDTAQTVAAKVLKIEHKLLPQAVKLYCESRLKIEGRHVIIK